MKAYFVRVPTMPLRREMLGLRNAFQIVGQFDRFPI